MSDSYVDGKVREALLQAKGSRSLAQQLLMQWALNDDRLLRGMAAPFIKAISGAAVAGAVKRGITVPGLGATAGARTASARTASVTTGTVSKADLARVLDRLGRGDEGGGEPEPARRPAAPAGAGRSPASPAAPAGQASTIQTLAAIYAKNRKRR
jgi:hypothetical protein